MPKSTTLIHALTVGEVSDEALARVDLSRTRLAADIQENIFPKVVGSAYFRPGLEYLGTTESNNFEVMVPLKLSATSGAIIHVSDEQAGFSIDGVNVSRESVTSTVTSGDFSSDTGWTLTASTGGTAAVTGGELVLTAGARGSTAFAVQGVTTSSANTEHALRIVVTRGPIVFRCGSTSGGSDYISETELREGTHSLAFTPTGTYYVHFSAKLETSAKVDSCTVEASGDVTMPAPWGEADLRKLRYAQSADVLFVGCEGYQQYRIEKRASGRSWSIVKYFANDGPFRLARDSNVKINPNVYLNEVTLTASSGYFTENHVGALIRIANDRQDRIVNLAGENVFSDPIRVSGIHADDYSDRVFTYTITGTWSGTIRWQRAFSDIDAGYAPFRKDSTTTVAEITTNVSSVLNQDLDNNSIIFYKIGFASGDYTSGQAQISISYSNGNTNGIARITSITNSTTATADVIDGFGSVQPTENWRPGEWSEIFGWPVCTTFFDGRLVWGGYDKFWASASDVYDSFDEENTDDGGPIIRNIATGGGVHTARWMLPLQRLIIGTDSAEVAVKASNFDEPLTPTGVTLTEVSNYGSSATVAPVKIDNNGIFVDRSGERIIEVGYSGETSDYASDELTKINRGLLAGGVVAMDVQRRPDTRVWIVRNDGVCVVLTYDRNDEIIAFTPMIVAADGVIEDVCVIPGSGQDRTYFNVRLTINGSTVRYRCRMALDSEVTGGTLNKQMDYFTSGTNSPASTTINVGTHLQGESVVVWADGNVVDGSYTVDGSGNITVPAAVTNWVAGSAYTWRFKSAKLAYSSGMGTAINQKTRVDQLGLLLVNTHNSGIQYGDNFNTMSDLPSQLDFEDVSNTIHATYDHKMAAHGGSWSTDARVHLKGSSPYPCTVSGIVMTVTTNDRA